MKIKNITISTLKLPLNRTFKTAVRTANSLEDLLVRIETDELIGYGTAPAATAVTGDTIEGMTTLMHEVVIPNLINKDALDRDAIYQNVFPKITEQHGVKMAVDLALFDLAAKAKGVPLYHFLGGQNQPLVTDVTISCGDKQAVKNNVDDALAKGFTTLKVKLGNNVKDDIAVCQLLADLLNDTIIVRFDANQGWSCADTLLFLDELQHIDLNVEFIEQPVAADDLQSMQKITERSAWPVVADESVFSLQDAQSVLQKNAANIVNIKLAKCGGIANAFKIKQLADEFGVECMLGCMMESPVGIAAAAHFALASGIRKIDLDPIDWVPTDAYAGLLDFSNATIRLSDRIGLGYQPVGE